MKKKILSVSSPSNPVEQQKAENAQAFGNNISKLISSDIIGNISMGTLGYNAGWLITNFVDSASKGTNMLVEHSSTVPSLVTMAVSLLVLLVSNRSSFIKFNNLQELYDKKGNEVQVTEEQSKQDNGRTM